MSTVHDRFVNNLSLSINCLNLCQLSRCQVSIVNMSCQSIIIIRTEIMRDAGADDSIVDAVLALGAYQNIGWLRQARVMPLGFETKKQCHCINK